MKKRYLKTVEDVLALKDTDTKIYEEHSDWYYKFVNGVLCRFNALDNIVYFYSCIDMEEDVYILEEEHMQEATADDVGMLCWFENKDRSYGFFDFLGGIVDDSDNPYQPENAHLLWRHCRRATPSEVAEVTGYKVSFADQSDAKVEEKE